MIFTFYSFKGGVGRSMALANVAELLYRRGAKVLMVDFDLEAPGLENYFNTSQAINQPVEVWRKRGLIDLLLSYKALRSLSQPKAPIDNEAKNSPISNGFAFPNEPLTNFIIPLYPENEKGGRLSIISAGCRAGKEFERYAQRVHAFNWDDFYTHYEGEQFFDWFRRETETIADFVLIDSRTGVTEMGGVCLYQLADAVVMFVTPNQQNLEGTQMMVQSLTDSELVIEGRRGRPLSLLFVPSRIEHGEAALLDRFATQYNHKLGKYIASQLKFEKNAFTDLKIPYVPYYAYQESVVARDDQPSSAGLKQAYENLTAVLEQFASEVHLVELSSVYTSDLFVGRQAELDELVQWATADSVPRRLITITAPPGYGKSWFLRQLENKLKPKHGRELFLIWAPTLRLRSKAEIARWLPSVVEEAKKYCPGIRTLDTATHSEAIIAALLEDLSKHCSPNLRPILIVDAFDELVDNERRELEKHLLERFWANPNVCIVMAFRDELSLQSSSLRRGEDRLHLPAFKHPFGQLQLQQRAKLQKDVPFSLEDLLNLIPSYNWAYPALNTYLYEIAKKRSLSNQSPLLTAADLRDCWVSLIKTKLDQEAIELQSIEKDLQAIATEDDWTLETFAEICQYTQSTALYRIQSLMALSLVAQARRQKYQIVDGLREIIRAEQRLRTIEEAGEVQPTKVVSTIDEVLKEASPFAEVKAEKELTFLFGESGGFWSRHPVYETIFYNPEPQVIIGQAGTGKTAFAQALVRLGSPEGLKPDTILPIYVNATSIRQIQANINPALNLSHEAPEVVNHWLDQVKATLAKSGWERIVLALDPEQATQTEVKEMMRRFAALASAHVIIKLFLKSELAPSGQLSTPLIQLTWTDEQLDEMAHWRFEPLITELNLRITIEKLFDEGMYVKFIRAAKGNPRRLALLWRSMFEDYRRRNPDRFSFSSENLASAVRQLE